MSEDAGLTWQWIYKDSDMYSIVQDPFLPHSYYFVGRDASDRAAKIIAFNAEEKTLKHSPHLVIEAFGTTFPTDFFIQLQYKVVLLERLMRMKRLHSSGRQKEGFS